MRGSDPQSPDRDRLRHRCTQEPRHVDRHTHRTPGDWGTVTQGQTHTRTDTGEACKTHRHGITSHMQTHSVGQTQTSPGWRSMPRIAPHSQVPGAGRWTHSSVPAWPAWSGPEPCCQETRCLDPTVCHTCPLCSTPVTNTSACITTTPGCWCQHHFVQIGTLSLGYEATCQSGRDGSNAGLSVTLRYTTGASIAVESQSNVWASFSHSLSPPIERPPAQHWGHTPCE